MNEEENWRPQGLETWRQQGEFSDFEGNQIFVRASGKAEIDGEGVLIVHGFPGSSWDWSGVIESVEKQTRVVAPDMLGYGQSDKPIDGNYSIFRSADMFEAIAARHGIRDCTLVIHDLGQTVGAELMMRQEEGKLSFRIRHAIVFNGSTFVDMVQLNELQKQLLAMPDEPFSEDLPRESFYSGLRGTFSKQHPASDETLDIMIAQIYEKHGSRLMPRLIRYLNERQQNLQRWTDGLTKFTSPETVIWGTEDKIAVEAMADRMKELRSAIDLHKWPDVAHWPPIEVPARVAQAIIDRI